MQNKHLPTTPLGSYLLQAREVINISQAELAKKIGVKEGVNISKWERGQTVPWIHFDALMKHLNLAPDKFFLLAEKCIPRAVAEYRIKRGNLLKLSQKQAPAISDFLSPRVLNKLRVVCGESSDDQMRDLINTVMDRHADTVLLKEAQRNLAGNLPALDVRTTEDPPPEHAAGTSKKEGPGRKSRRRDRLAS